MNRRDEKLPGPTSFVCDIIVYELFLSTGLNNAILYFFFCLYYFVRLIFMHRTYVLGATNEKKNVFFFIIKVICSIKRCRLVINIGIIKIDFFFIYILIDI